MVMLVGLTIAIGLTVGALAWQTTTFERDLPETKAADPAIGYAFYAGIDRLLQDGDASALEETVTGDFVDHRGDSETPGTIETLTERLTAFATSFPGARIDVTGIQESGSALVVTIAPITVPPVDVAGMSMTTPPIRGGYDVLKIHNGKVAERWSAGLPDIATASFPAASLSVSSSTNMATQVMRTELPGDVELTWRSGRTAVLMVESGAVRVNRSWMQAHAAKDDTVIVQAGEILLISPNMAARLRSANGDAVRLLTFAMWRVTPVEMAASGFSGKASTRLLWTGNLSLSTADRWSVSFGRVQLPASTNISFDGLEAQEVLLCAETSEWHVTALDGVVEAYAADLTRIERAPTRQVDPAAAAHVVGASSIEIESDPDAGGAIWLITIAPEERSATPVASSVLANRS